MSGRSQLLWRIVVLTALALLVAACGDGGQEEAADKRAPAANRTADANTIKVTGQDYRFEGLPAQVKAGTKLTLTNASTKEIHELTANPLPASETRPVADLLKLPAEQLQALFTGPPTTVLIAPPGGEPQIQALGDGTMQAPGRYVVYCSIPTGADPQAYIEATKAAHGQEPPKVSGGPPHFTQGMFAELTVQ